MWDLSVVDSLLKASLSAGSRVNWESLPVDGVLSLLPSSCAC